VEDTVIDWLLEDTNPVIAYRTRVELLNGKANGAKAIDPYKAGA